MLKFFSGYRPQAAVGTKPAFTLDSPIWAGVDDGTGSMGSKRRRFKQTHSLEERLAEEAKNLREEAKTLPPGVEKEILLKKAWQNDTAARMSEWLLSPMLKPPD